MTLHAAFARYNILSPANRYAAQVAEQADALRNQMAQDIIDQGGGTIAQLMAVAFGHWPPRGMSLADNDRLRKHIKVLDEPDPELARRGNYSWVHQQITMNSAARNMGRYFYSTLAHEAMHALQHAAWEEEYSQDKRKRKTEPDIICAELRKDYPVQPMRLRDQFAEFAGLRGSRKWLDYAGKGIEFQARLFQLMADGYPVWQRLPSDKEEFQAALVSCGVLPPAEVRQDIAANVSGRSPFAQKLFGNHRLAVAVGKLLNDYPPEAQERLWNDTLPRLYTNMLDMMGLASDSWPRAPQFLPEMSSKRPSGL